MESPHRLIAIKGKPIVRDCCKRVLSPSSGFWFFHQKNNGIRVNNIK